MANSVKLLVGLGNPGKEYEATRHNAGDWLVRALCDNLYVDLKAESKFHGLFSSTSINGEKLYLLIPTTYMNESGRAVQAAAKYYNVAPHEVLVAHDDLDIDVGQVKIKHEGGHGGHNGLRSIIKCLNTPKFNRLRIGIGHPGDRNRVSDYVLSRASKADNDKINQSIIAILDVFPDIIAGDWQKSMRILHTQ